MPKNHDNRGWWNSIHINNEPRDEEEDEYDSEDFSDLQRRRRHAYDKYQDAKRITSDESFQG